MNQTVPTELTGYHGCDRASVPGILADNFSISQREDLWYGPAVYFYAECEVYPSADQASQWAVKAARTKGDHRLRYVEYAVLKVVITALNLLDLTKDEGKMMFQRTLKALRERRLPIKNEWEDAGVIKFMISEFEFDVLVADVYSRFNFEDVNNTRSRVANTRIISVYRPQNAIDINKIVLVSTGPVSPPPL